MNPPTHRRRPSGPVAFAMMMVAVMIVGGLAGIGSAFLKDQSNWLGSVGTIILIGAATLFAFVGCLWWWRGIDEAAREAHKWAWWWGGSTGMAVGAAVVVMLDLQGDGLVLPSAFGSESTEFMATGMMAILIFQLVGYVLAWAGWWLKHR